MNDSEKLDRLIDELRIMAAHSTRYEMNEDFNPSDGGNFDDAYDAGFEDGMTTAARDLLAYLGVLLASRED